MPQSSPTPAQRVTRALQHAHARAERDRDQAADHLQHLTELHARAVASLHDAHAEEQALAAALAEAGGRLWSVEQAERDKAAHDAWQVDQARAAALVERAREQAGPEPTPARIVATARRLAAQAGAGTAQDVPPVPEPVQAGTAAAVDVLLSNPTPHPGDAMARAAAALDAADRRHQLRREPLHLDVPRTDRDDRRR